MGWVSGFKEARGWNGCASLPRVLSLTDDDRLIQTPLPELAGLRDRTSVWKGALDDEGRGLPGERKGGQARLRKARLSPFLPLSPFLLTDQLTRPAPALCLSQIRSISALGFCCRPNSSQRQC